MLPQAHSLIERLWRLPTNASLHGPALDAHLLLNLWIVLALLALAHLLIFSALISRRTRRRRTFLLESLPLAALACLFIFLAARAEALWQHSRYAGPDPSALQVEVTGMQFAWYFRYPGRDATFGVTRLEFVAPAEGNPLGLDRSDTHGADDIVSSQLILPANREVDLRLRAQDVIHGFSVPEMRLKQNAVPGQTIHIHFTPAMPGEYAILCSQLCGSGHYRMAATLRVVPEAQFNAWLAEQDPRRQFPTGAAR